MDSITVIDLIGGTATIRSAGPAEWTVTQRGYGPEHDNNHVPTWLRVANRGPAARVRLRIRWAATEWMGCRPFAYLRRGYRWEAIRGRIGASSTTYEFDAPHGALTFGATPWYANEDAARFVRRMARAHRGWSVDSIGKSGEGRDILRLAAGREGAPNVVVLAREHANETSGSFAVESAAEYLAAAGPSSPWLRRCRFHFIPIVNPDGVAHGAKLTRPGQARQYDMVQGGMTSPDATIVALREEMTRLKPALLIMHHTYLQPTPWLGGFDKRLLLAMLDRLLELGGRDLVYWSVRITGPEKGTLRSYCHSTLGAAVLITELPWYGRTPDDVRALGEDFFLAALSAVFGK
jgi:hypothetical protein